MSTARGRTVISRSSRTASRSANRTRPLPGRRPARVRWWLSLAVTVNAASPALSVAAPATVSPEWVIAKTSTARAGAPPLSGSVRWTVKSVGWRTSTSAGLTTACSRLTTAQPRCGRRFLPVTVIRTVSPPTSPDSGRTARPVAPVRPAAWTPGRPPVHAHTRADGTGLPVAESDTSTAMLSAAAGIAAGYEAVSAAGRSVQNARDGSLNRW